MRTIRHGAEDMVPGMIYRHINMVEIYLAFFLLDAPQVFIRSKDARHHRVFISCTSSRKAGERTPTKRTICCPRIASCLRCQVFGLKLTPSELGAAMKEFDRDGDGTVNCAEFLLTFFRIGFEGRNRALQR